jgi:hypothetical protein
LLETTTCFRRAAVLIPSRCLRVVGITTQKPGDTHSMVPWDETDLPTKPLAPLQCSLLLHQLGNGHFKTTTTTCRCLEALLPLLLKIPSHLRMSFEAARSHIINFWCRSTLWVSWMVSVNPIPDTEDQCERNERRNTRWRCVMCGG